METIKVNTFSILINFSINIYKPSMRIQLTTSNTKTVKDESGFDAVNWGNGEQNWGEIRLNQGSQFWGSEENRKRENI